MQITELKGTYSEIGRQYGSVMKGKIQENINILIHRKGCEPLPINDSEFKNWIDSQEKIIGENWPWLLEEMKAVAEGAELEYREILMLNLRAWQYSFYSGKSPGNACSNILITLNDGKVALAGALDDPSMFYCGCIKYQPNEGKSFFTFPITGTSWATRGINNDGLAVGISSQILQGLKRKENSINQDIAIRVIFETCSTIDEIRDFCKKFPFTMNITAVDSDGKVFCAHNTTAGLFEVADNVPCVLTNHVSDDKIMYELSKLGVGAFRENKTPRARRGKLLDFASEKEGECYPEDVMKIVADRAGNAVSSICPEGNYCVTYACPQAEKDTLYISAPRLTDSDEWKRYNLK